MTGSLQRPSRLDVTWTGDGDHVVVTGEVEAISERPGEPLLLANGVYTGLGR